MCKLLLNCLGSPEIQNSNDVACNKKEATLRNRTPRIRLNLNLLPVASVTVLRCWVRVTGKWSQS